MTDQPPPIEAARLSSGVCETISPTTGELRVFVVCFILSAFFSGSESALQSLNEARPNLIDDGHERLSLWLDQPHLCADLEQQHRQHPRLGARWYHRRRAADVGLNLAVAVMTILVLIFGEVIPKNYASVRAR